MSDKNRPFDAVLIQGGRGTDEVFDQDATIPYVAVRTDDGSVIEPVDRRYTPNSLGKEMVLETEPEPETVNVYELTSQMTRRVLWGQKQEAALEQAKAYLTYGDQVSALQTLEGFGASFARKYGACT